jgi:hypothetical protein
MNVKVNLNCKVKVKLTTRGEAVIQAIYSNPATDYEVPVDEQGYYHTNLWVLMKDLGILMRPLGAPVIDGDIIVYEDNGIDEGRLISVI